MDFDDSMVDILTESRQRFWRRAVAMETLEILGVEEAGALIPKMLAVLGMQQNLVRRLNCDSCASPYSRRAGRRTRVPRAGSKPALLLAALLQELVRAP
jgi:hypothetical protein